MQVANQDSGRGPSKAPLAIGILVVGVVLFLITKPFGGGKPATPPTMPEVVQETPKITQSVESAHIPQMAAAPASEGEIVWPNEELKRGYEISMTLCNSCHLRPPPEALDKVNWAMEVLPTMAIWLGMLPAGEDPYDYIGAEQRVRDAKIMVNEAMLTLEDWRAVCAYYLDQAPSELVQPKREEIKVGLPLFSAVIPSFKSTPTTSMVRIDPVEHKIYVGSASRDGENSLSILNADGYREKFLPTPSPPIDIDIRKDRLLITLIGNYLPSDELNGRVTLLAKPGYNLVQGDLLRDLPRPTDSIFADLNNDGLEDIIVCGYGNILGQFSWFENKGDAPFEEHPLLDQNGCIQAITRDVNGDGYLDIFVLCAQQREGLHLFINDQNGQFTPKQLLAQHAAWGYAHFDVVDWDGDGDLDLLTANGDNGDHTEHLPPFKPYHGLRIYLNDGDYNFTESWFYPLNGAFHIVARDFDLDGDLDLAATSFYPDYRKSAGESFVYFENTGKGLFDLHPRTIPECTIGRWITLDTNDLDGDGDLDIVLAAFNEGPSFVPNLLHQKWMQDGPPILILKNMTK